jgi:glycosyltransferase involved in cell wall biosynthesis
MGQSTIQKSIDNTKDMLKQYVEKQCDQFIIKYLYQENAGAQVARNTGTKASSGEFIQYLDSDDLLYKEKLFHQVRFLEEDALSDGVFGNWDSGTLENFQTVSIFKSGDMVSQMLTGQSIHTLSLLMRRSMVNRTGPWDINIKRYQEVDFHISALMKGAKLASYPINCGLWRYHELERIHNTTGIREFITFYQKWEKKLSEVNLFTQKLALDISKLYLYQFSQYQHELNPIKVLLLKEIIRLDPSVAFYNNPKMQLIVKLLGVEKALLIWIRRFAAKSAKRKKH